MPPEISKAAKSVLAELSSVGISAGPTVLLHGELRGSLELPPGVSLECAPGSSIIGGPALDPTRDVVIAVMRKLCLERDRDLHEARVIPALEARFSAAAYRTSYAIEALRQALDLPCGWETEGT